MGIGCNAAGVTSCRIIESKRERLIAILTNNFIPCNGRYPSVIAMAAAFSLFLGFEAGAAFKAFYIFCGLALSVGLTLGISKILSMTILRGAPSGFVLELPPYRKPQIIKSIVTSIYDKTAKTLLRAICSAAPAGLLLWVLQSVNAGGKPLLYHMTVFFEPFGAAIGLDGVILTAFVLGIPANEIVLPIMLLCYSGGFGAGLAEITDLGSIFNVFAGGGWSFVTVICVTIFFFNHFPCATTLITIKKETGSIGWTLLAFVIPTITGILLCFVTSNVLNLLL